MGNEVPFSRFSFFIPRLSAARTTDEENCAPELPAHCGSLRAQAGHEVAFRVYAVGVPVYIWRGGAWAFGGPVADLYDDDYRGLAAPHYRGPFWEGNSGSRVMGKSAIPCSPAPTAIPWLRLEAALTEGTGSAQRRADGSRRRDALRTPLTPVQSPPPGGM